MEKITDTEEVKIWVGGNNVVKSITIMGGELQFI